MDAFIGAPLIPRDPRAQSELPAPQNVPESIRRVAHEFESVFLAQMMAPMFEGLDTDGLGGGGDGERMFRPMLIDQYAQAISKSGGIGLADSIMREMMQMQSANGAPNSSAVAAASAASTTASAVDLANLEDPSNGLDR